MSSARLVKFGIPALVAMLVLAALAQWALNASNSGSGVKEGISYQALVSYVVRDAAGNIKQQGSGHNAINSNPNLDSIVNRLIATTTPMATTSLFAQIVAVSTSTLVDAPTDGFSVGNVALALDGNPNVGGDQNPANGKTTGSTGGAGSGTVVVTFTAKAANVQVSQLGLVQTTEGVAVAITTGELLAAQSVSILLQANDTLQVTWTVTATASSSF